MPVGKEIVVFKKTTKSSTPRKEKKGKMEVVLKARMKKPKSNSNRVPKSGKARNPKMLEFLSALTMPDIVGPVRVPRPGGAGRTVLGMDKTIMYVVGSATNVIQGVTAVTGYSASYAPLTGTTSLSTLTSTGSVAPGVQFPPSVQIDDMSLTACCMTISYTSNPLTVAGELLIGCVSVDNVGLVGNATYTSLYYYPGMIKLPISSLLEKPLRVYMVKSSPDSDTFYGPTIQVPDCLRPIILTNLMPVGGSVSVEITRTWECHSNVQSTGNGAIPYASGEGGYSADLSAYQDCQMKLANGETTVENAATSYLTGLASQYLGGVAATSAVAALSYMGKRAWNTHVNSRGPLLGI